MLGFHPSFLIFEELRFFFNVPSGKFLSKFILPSKPTSLEMLLARFFIFILSPLPTLIIGKFSLNISFNLDFDVFSNFIIAKAKSSE